MKEKPKTKFNLKPKKEKKPENKMTEEEVSELKISNKEVLELQKKHPNMSINSLRNLVIWKKGRRPKGAGKPKGATHKSFAIRMIKALENGDITRDYLVDILIERAAEGDLTALKMVREWCGEEKDKLDVNLSGNLDIDNTVNTTPLEELPPGLQEKYLKDRLKELKKDC